MGQRPRYEAISAALPLAVRLAPGASADSVQVFALPAAAADIGLVLNSGFGPGYFVIGESPLLHRPALMRLGLVPGG